jgi:flagellar biosynthesis protein
MDDQKNKKPDKTAIALSYNPADPAPKVIATGKGYLAERIIERAKEQNIPLHKDDALANSLSKLALGSYIPPELYEIVSEILVFVGNMDELKSKVYHNE